MGWGWMGWVGMHGWDQMGMGGIMDWLGEWWMEHGSRRGPISWSVLGGRAVIGRPGKPSRIGESPGMP